MLGWSAKRASVIAGPYRGSRRQSVSGSLRSLYTHLISTDRATTRRDADQSWYSRLPTTARPASGYRAAKDITCNPRT